MLDINFWVNEVERLVKEGKSIGQSIEIVLNIREEYNNGKSIITRNDK